MPAKTENEADETVTANGTSRRPAWLTNRNALIGLAVLVVVVLAGLFINQLHTNSQLKKENQKLSNPQAAAQAETQALKNKVGQLIELPSNETPTIATVVDVSKLKSQAFFADAQNGDKVLIFTQAKKAILYRPSTDKIIQVAPVNIGNSGSAAGTATSP